LLDRLPFEKLSALEQDSNFLERMDIVYSKFRKYIDSASFKKPEIAYFECLHELKLIVDLMYKHGIAGMRYSISNTAEYGDLTVGPKIIDDSVKTRMKEALGRIQSGEFAKEFVEESKGGYQKMNQLREAGKEHQIEKVGAELRSMMPWLKGDKLV